jgi:hypothetical protein
VRTTIAKFVALKQAGLADEDVRLILVRDLVVNEDHAVVAARLGSKWVILDNRWLALVEDSTMHRLRPLFVLARGQCQSVRHSDHAAGLGRRS